MRRLTPAVLVLHTDERFVHAVREATPEGVASLRASDWKALLETASTVPPGSVAVVDPFFGEPDRPGREPPPSRRLRELRNHFPSLPVIVAWHVRPEHHGQLRQVGAWGVVDVIDLASENTPAMLQRRVERAHRTVAARVLPPDALAGLLVEARDLIRRALDVALRGALTAHWAASEGVSARTLLRWCEMLALPPPRRLLSWMRVLLAADLVDNPGHTVATAARASGYAAEPPLRRAVENLLGAPLQEVRRTGALRTALAAFTAELAQLREVTTPQVPERRRGPRRRPRG